MIVSSRRPRLRPCAKAKAIPYGRMSLNSLSTVMIVTIRHLSALIEEPIITLDSHIVEHRSRRSCLLRFPCRVSLWAIPSQPWYYHSTSAGSWSLSNRVCFRQPEVAPPLHYLFENFEKKTMSHNLEKNRKKTEKSESYSSVLCWFPISLLGQVDICCFIS